MEAKKNISKKIKKTIWNDTEREAWRLPKKITVSEWADEFRILTPLTSAEPGLWRTARTPYLRGIMDAFNDPLVEEITVMASTQIGKTEAIYNMLAFAIDQDPGPALIVMPRVPDAKSVSQNRVKPLLMASAPLKTHLPILEDDITKLEYHLDHMIVYFAGSNSPADLAHRPVRYLFLDEVDKFPKFSGREADPIKLATERTRTFWNRKIIKVSTPTTRQGYIFREYEKSDRRRYFVPCPYCHQYQILVFAQIKWPEGETDYEKIKTNRTAYYECQYCNKKITEYQKLKIITSGLWAAEDAEITNEGKIISEVKEKGHRGFWISALYSPWLSFSDIAAEFLKSKDYTELLMNFVNSWLAEIWEEKTEETKPNIIISLTGTYKEGTVPAGVLVLTAGVDIQKDHFYIAIRGWGLGEESWLIRACRAESWEEVISILFLTNYQREKKEGEPLSVRLSCIDSGYRTDEVYEVCRKYRDIARPIKGHDHLPGAPYRISHIDRHPESGIAIPGGLSLWHVDTSHFKNKINRMVHADPGDPAQWHIHAEPSDEYLKQFCSEQKIIDRDRKTGRTKEEWRLISAGTPNHFLDAENYAVAAADMIRVSAMRKEEAQTFHPRENKNATENIRRDKPINTWLGDRRNWLRK